MLDSREKKIFKQFFNKNFTREYESGGLLSIRQLISCILEKISAPIYGGNERNRTFRWQVTIQNTTFFGQCTFVQYLNCIACFATVQINLTQSVFTYYSTFLFAVFQKSLNKWFHKASGDMTPTSPV